MLFVGERHGAYDKEHVVRHTYLGCNMAFRAGTMSESTILEYEQPLGNTYSESENFSTCFVLNIRV